MTGARLRPIGFGSHKCDEHERHYHSFVGEAAAGRWDFEKNKRHAYGTHFSCCVNPPATSNHDREQQIVHHDFACPEVTCFGTTVHERWPAIAYTDQIRVHRIRPISGLELLDMFGIPVKMQYIYGCTDDMDCNIAFRLGRAMPTCAAELLGEPLLNDLLCDHHDPEETSPMP
jgi:hypothetical protein